MDGSSLGLGAFQNGTSNNGASHGGGLQNDSQHGLPHHGKLSPGSWQAPYAQLHRRILSGGAPRRYVISIAWSGMSDRVNGAIAAFLFGLLTDRALLIGFNGGDHFFPMGYLPASINWTLPYDMGNWTAPGVQFVDLYYGTCKREAPHNFYQRLGRENVSEIIQPLDQEVVIFHHNCGWLRRVFQNPHHRDQLHALGLTEVNAFKSIFEFLFKLPEKAVEIAQPFLDIFARPNVVSIAMQIRLGDRQLLSGQNVEGECLSFLRTLAAPFLDCVGQLQADLKTPKNQVRWFFISDSLELRTWINATYNDSMTIIPERLGHTSDMNLATAEQWIFGKADFHIISELSTFGRIGAALAAKPYDNVFTVHQRQPYNDMWNERYFPSFRNCRIDDADARKVWTADWSQI